MTQISELEQRARDYMADAAINAGIFEKDLEEAELFWGDTGLMIQYPGAAFAHNLYPTPELERRAWNAWCEYQES